MNRKSVGERGPLAVRAQVAHVQHVVQTLGVREQRPVVAQREPAALDPSFHAPADQVVLDDFRARIVARSRRRTPHSEWMIRREQYPAGASLRRTRRQRQQRLKRLTVSVERDDRPAVVDTEHDRPFRERVGACEGPDKPGPADEMRPSSTSVPRVELSAGAMTFTRLFAGASASVHPAGSASPIGGTPPAEHLYFEVDGRVDGRTHHVRARVALLPARVRRRQTSAITSRSRARPRDTRDFTVPGAQRIVSAISFSEAPS